MLSMSLLEYRYKLADIYSEVIHEQGVYDYYISAYVSEEGEFFFILINTNNEVLASVRVCINPMYPLLIRMGIDIRAFEQRVNELWTTYYNKVVLIG